MKFWKTFAALGVSVGLLAYVFLVEQKRPDTPEKTKQKVFTLDKTKVKEVTLVSPEGEIRLVKEGANWKMAAPFSVPADATEADALVNSLESLEVDEEVTPSATSLTEFGLEKPKTTVSVLLEGATEPLKLAVGDKVPAGSGLYAKLPSQPRVFTIASYLESTLAKKPFDLRDRDLLHVKRDAVTALEVTGPEGAYALARDDKGEWAFTQPLQTRAGRWSVDGILGALEGLRMESVAAENAKDLKPFGLDKPTRTVTVGLADGGKKVIQIGSTTASPSPSPSPTPSVKGPSSSPETTSGGKKHYAREASMPLVAVIPPALVDDLAKGMKELRAKRLLEVAAYEVEGFDVLAGGTKSVFARSSSKDKEGVETQKWKKTAPDAKDLETNRVQDVLFKVGGVEVAEFVDAPGALSQYGLDAPALKVALRFGGGKPEAWFEIGQKDGASFARRPGDAAILKLDNTKTDELVKAFKEI